VAGVAAVILIAVAVVLPAFADRGLIQDLFFILTMLVLAQFWNLLAGYGGLVSVGQQALGSSPRHRGRTSPTSGRWRCCGIWGRTWRRRPTSSPPSRT
jgi:hypothetical protein